jgi:thioesterase domain-containing protein
MSVSQTSVRIELTTQQRAVLRQRLQEVRARAAAVTPAASPLVRLSAGKGGVRPFFCVHAIGGAVFSYVELAQSLGPELPFYGLQARGLDGRSEPLEDLEEMARQYVRAIRTVQPVGPYRLGGWSFGGAVALEMARQLRAEGAEVDLLALLDSWSPAVCAAVEPTEAEVRETVERDLGAAAGLIGGEQLERIKSVYRAHLQALFAYRPEPWLDESVFTTLFRAQLLPGVPDIHANGWGDLILGDLEICQVPGDHYSMLARPQVEVLAERLAARLGL